MHKRYAAHAGNAERERGNFENACRISGISRKLCIYVCISIDCTFDIASCRLDEFCPRTILPLAIKREISRVILMCRATERTRETEREENKR